MQKRTNPLELKVDNSAPRRETPAATSVTPTASQEPTAKVAEPVVQKAEPIMKQTKTTDEKKTVQQTVITEKPVEEKKPVVKRPTVKKIAPVIETDIPKVSESKRQSEPDRDVAAPAVSGALRWERVTAQKPAITVEPEQNKIEEQPIIATAPRIEPVVPVYVAPAVESEADQLETVEEIADNEVLDAPEMTEEDIFDSEDGISDEEEPLTIDDYMMSARFSLCGRVARGMKMGKISRDVCRLAQLMHPEKSLSTILEDALLTRIYLENPDAFDALAEMLEKKGGHIKC